MNLRDVARRAGVSPMTVSNVLNGRSSVRKDNRERVLRAIEELGYTPNVSARQLRRGRAQLVGVIVPESINPFYGDVVRGIDERADEAGTAVLTMTSHDSLQREETLLDLLGGMRVTGVVLSSVSNWAGILPRVRALTSQGIPLVALATAQEVGEACSSVSGDDHLGGELVGRHLAELGHRRVGFVGGALGLAVFDARYNGLRAGLDSAGAESVTVDYVECGEPTLEAGYERAMDLLDAPHAPTAVFCANDLLALGVLRAAVARGVRVPEDLAIAGYDDIPFADGAAVPLTSVGQATRDMGRCAAELLLAQADEGPHEVTHKVFPPTLRVRASTHGVQ